MLRSSSPRAGFTLIEMLTVMLIIGILAGIVLSINGLAQNKAARSRAEGEIHALAMSCENYKTDRGSYPRSPASDALDPRVNFDPTQSTYTAACLILYSLLSGDNDHDGQTDTGEKDYTVEFFKPSVLNGTKDANGRITLVNFIKDPFDNCYGYSTAGLAAEEKFIDELRKNPSATREDTSKGYNPTFDLWSTAAAPFTAAGQAKWVKNW